MVARLTVQARGGAGRSPAALLTVAPGCEGGTSDVDLDAYLREFGAALARRDAQTSASKHSRGGSGERLGVGL